MLRHREWLWPAGVQSGVLGFELLQPLGVGDVHASELGLPSVERGVAKAVLAAQLLHWQASRLASETQ